MARKKIHDTPGDDDNEQGEPASGDAQAGPLPLVTGQPFIPGDEDLNPYVSTTAAVPFVAPEGQVAGSAVGGGNAKSEPPQQYRVTANMLVTLPGGRVMFRAGKLVDSANYDIRGLRSQGVPLEPVESEQHA